VAARESAQREREASRRRVLRKPSSDRPLEEILRDQVRPLIAEGASGVGFWTGFSYYTRAACSAQDLGASQQEARYAFTRDFLGGVTPLSWTDPAVYAELVLDTSLLTRQRLDEIRADLQSQPSGGD